MKVTCIWCHWPREGLDKIPKRILWKCLEFKDVSVIYIRAIKNMYDGDKIGARIMGGDSEHVSIKMRLNQGRLARFYLPWWWMNWHIIFRMRCFSVRYLHMTLFWLSRLVVELTVGWRCQGRLNLWKKDGRLSPQNLRLHFFQ